MHTKRVTCVLIWVVSVFFIGGIATAAAGGVGADADAKVGANAGATKGAGTNTGAGVNMLDCGGFACITLELGAGKSVKVLFDSGNVRSILDLAQAKALGLPLGPYTRDGKVVPDRYTTEVTNASVGKTLLPSVKFVVVNLQKFVDQGQIPPAQGLLSYTALKDRVLTLDYGQRHVTISDWTSVKVPTKNTGLITYPTFGQDGPAIVATTGFQVNGRPIRVQVDTLYGGTLLIYPTSVEKLGLTAQARSSKTRRFPFTDGGVDMIEGKASKESFGGTDLLSEAPLYFATPQVHLPDGMFDGTVGVGLFIGRSVTFDFHANRFWIG
jgi:hypothetical protein